MPKKPTRITAPSEPRFLTINQAAELAVCSVPFIRKQVANKVWPITRLGRTLRIDARAFDAWIKANTEPAEIEVA